MALPSKATGRKWKEKIGCAGHCSGYRIERKCLEKGQDTLGLRPSGEIIVRAKLFRRASPIQQDYIRPAGRKLGLGDIGWHTSRHTYRSWLDSVKTSMGVQQKLMRHAQISTTMNVYGNALMKSKRQANSKVVRMALRPALSEAK
jgi:integrase